MSDLPEPGAPLELADGRRIDPATGSVIRDNEQFVAVPNNEQAKQLVATTRKKLIDLPDTPQRMNVLGAMVSYDLVGLDHSEIGIALGISADQVTRVMESDSFTKFRDEIVASMAQRQSDEVRGVVNGAAINAARRISALVGSEDESIALSAAKDMLDRDGHRPNDVIEHRHVMDGGLTIRYVDDSNTRALDSMTIDGEVLGNE